MHRSINLAFATIALIATITGYISLIPNIARSQQPTPKTCNRATKEGYPFPSSSGYVSGYQVKAKTGLSTVRFDNSQGNFDLFIKLFTLSSERPQTIRAFLVKQGQEFTIENVTRGTYDVRYRNLSTCKLFRTKKFKLKEEKTSDRIQFSRIELTTYKVPQGTSHHESIKEEDF